jgi:hypothetical protein
MKPKVYLETTIPSYLTSRPSRDLLVAAHQQLTNDWWQDHRHRFSLYVSPRVLAEAGSGDPVAAARRLTALQGVAVLNLTDEARELAQRFLDSPFIPANAFEDALHVAIATVHGMDYLLTWNCRHIANAEIVRGIAGVAAGRGCQLPVICTPEQLMGD